MVFMSFSIAYAWRGKIIKPVVQRLPLFSLYSCLKDLNSVYYLTLGDLHTVQVHTFYSIFEIGNLGLVCA